MKSEMVELMSGNNPALEADPDHSATGYALEQLQNIGHCVTGAAIRWPQTSAVAAPVSGFSDFLKRCWRRNTDHRAHTRFRQITYAELEARSNQIANGLIERGLTPGMRIGLMVPPGIDFVVWVFALFKAQAVVILIDPGMGRKNMIRCLADAKPEGIVGITLAHLMRTLFLRRVKECRFNVVLGAWPGCYRAASFRHAPTSFSNKSNQDREQPAAIIFTTGSTGIPKGVLYRHRTFIEQARQIRDYFGIKPGTVDVSGFPLFALFNIGMGATTIFPRMDPTRPASVDPPEIIHAVETFQANQSFGSPALWHTVSKYCIEHDVRLPTLIRVLSAGAPVAPDLLARIKQLISTDGEAFTPYGATESLPVACISASEVLNETAQQSRDGAGTCVGKSFPEMNWKILRISDMPIEDFSQCELLGPGMIGELIVQGAVSRISTSPASRRMPNIKSKTEIRFGIGWAMSGISISRIDSGSVVVSRTEY